MNAFVDDLMSRMTLEEKIGQLNLLSVGFDVTGPVLSKDADTKIRQGLVGGVFNTYTPGAVRKLQSLAVKESRLGIPLLFGYDVIHGHKTIFPIPLGLSCTWNLDSIERSARIAATEASADGVNWTFSPMVDIARDPRWGRIAEGAGEDPYLGAQIARAMVRGYQGDDLSRSNALMACVKHFALYGAAEAGRDYNTVDMSRLKMYQYYLPPYRAAVEAGAGSVMSSFNEINGVPATANHWLLTDLLRTQWGFQGFVVTDYTAISEMSEHGMGDLRKDAELALKAGVDMDMVSETYLKYLPELVAHGEISESMINQACRRILEAKYKLGLFADPYHGCTEERARAEILTPENRKAAREIAEQSFVLLKNDRQLLPLKKSGIIALVGPLADDQQNLLGCCRAAGDWQQAVSVRTGISNVAGPAVTILHAKGANLMDDPALRATLKAFGDGDSGGRAFAPGDDGGSGGRGGPRGRGGGGARRILRHERRGRKPQRHRTSGMSGGPVASAGGNRQTARAGADERPAVDVDLGSGALRRDSRNLVWRHRSGQCHRRCAVRRLQSVGETDGDLSAQRRSDPHLLQSQEHGASLQG